MEELMAGGIALVLAALGYRRRATHPAGSPGRSVTNRGTAAAVRGAQMVSRVATPIGGILGGGVLLTGSGIALGAGVLVDGAVSVGELAMAATVARRGRQQITAPATPTGRRVDKARPTKRTTTTTGGTAANKRAGSGTSASRGQGAPRRAKSARKRA